MSKETLETRKSRRDIGLVAGKKVYKLLSCQRTRKRRNTAERNDESEPFLDLPDTPTSKSSRFDTENQTPPQSPSSPRLKPPTYREVLTAQSALNLAVYTLLAMHAVGYDALIAIYLHHPVQAHDAPGVNLPFRFSGGLGMDSQGIGFMWTVYAVWGAFIQLVIFPPVARAFGELAVLRASSHAFPIVYLLHPFAAMLPTARGRQLAVLVLMMLKGALSIAAFPCSAILMTNSAASVRVLGLLNGLAVSISAVGRGGGPALAGASFSLGADIQFGMLSWIVLALFGVLAAAPQWWLRQMEGFGDKPEAAKRSSESDGAARPNGNGKAGYEAVQQDGEDELANSNDPSDPFVGSPDRTRRV